ncbi:CBS domain-containing protein, partial [Caballeronia choica]|uniref:CBS domain-containing protein n=1 Tax=Caballeronia choica TaxID=326476 RepID=UPI000AE43572
ATLVAHGFTTVVMKRSIMTEKIARRGYHIYREYGVDPLERHHVDEVMSRTVQTIDADLTVREALATFFGEKQGHRAYPAVRGEAVIGMVDRAMLERDPASSVGDALRGGVPVVALPGETCRLVATRLAVHGLERLPVVADQETRRLVGIVSRSDLVKPSLAHFDEEHKKERFRRIHPQG